MIRWILRQALAWPSLTAHGLRATLSSLMASCRWEVHGVENLLDSAAAGPCLLLLWHDRLVPVASLLNREAPSLRYHAVVSDSKDGRLLARYTKTFPQAQVISISSQSRSFAVKAMTVPLQRAGNVVIATPDGPKGPRRLVKKGIVKVAQLSQARVVPFHWEASHSWQLGSWDKMAIPKPFSSLSFSFGTPIEVPSSCSLEEGCLLLGDALNSLEHVR